MKRQSCAVLGCSPMCFTWGYDEEDEGCAALKLLLVRQISLLASKGVTRFAVAIDSGIGLYAAETVIGLQSMNPALTLCCYVPFEEQATKWTPELRNRYFEALGASTEVVTLYPGETYNCRYEAKVAAIETADTAIVGLNLAQPEQAIDSLLIYMEKAGMNVFLIDPGRGVLSSSAT